MLPEPASVLGVVWVCGLHSLVRAYPAKDISCESSKQGRTLKAMNLLPQKGNFSGIPAHFAVLSGYQTTAVRYMFAEHLGILGVVKKFISQNPLSELL
jgi:hypothetical protein